MIKKKKYGTQIGLFLITLFLGIGLLSGFINKKIANAKLESDFSFQ